jgi:hypothetical protein
MSSKSYAFMLFLAKPRTTHHSCIHTYIYVYVCVYIYIYIYIYNKTHEQKNPLSLIPFPSQHSTFCRFVSSSRFLLLMALVFLLHCSWRALMTENRVIKFALFCCSQGQPSARGPHPISDFLISITRTGFYFCPDSSVSIVTSLRTGWLGSGFLQGQGTSFFGTASGPSSGAHPSFYPVGAGSFFPGDRTAGAWRWWLISFWFRGAVPLLSQCILVASRLVGRWMRLHDVVLG